MERVLTLNLRKALVAKPRRKRRGCAVRLLRQMLRKRTRREKIELSPRLNELIWAREAPPAQLKIKIVTHGERVRAELAE
jgi:ribosomal protein L31E